MSNDLFKGFEGVSKKEWKQKIQFDLKGGDYNELLIYKTLEGIDIKPFYHQEDIENKTPRIQHPGQWKNSLCIDVPDAQTGNQKAIEAIQKGAESLFFLIKDQEIVIEDLLKKIDPKTPIYIQPDFISDRFAKKLDTISKKEGYHIYILNDIIGRLATTGNWFNNYKKDHHKLKSILHNSKHLKGVISIDISIYQNAGSTMYQQLAYGLAQINEYLNYFNSDHPNVLNRMPIVFKVAVGGNYFFEIAKIRALRWLWKTLSSEYGIDKECHIIAHPSLRNKTVLDYNVNMLRTTTECMSAILGGVNVVYNLPYDVIYNNENEFGTRISLNQLLILKHESYFNQVTNPASGSYYIETITTQLAEKALQIFKSIEQTGGFLKQLKSGKLQKKIEESAQKEQQYFDNGELILTGVNKYQNKEEIIPTPQKPIFSEKKKDKTLVIPILPNYLAVQDHKN